MSDCTEPAHKQPVVSWFPNLSGTDTRQVPEDLYHFWILNDGQGNLLSYRAAHFELVKLDENGAETVIEPGENGAFPRESVDLQTGLISHGYALRLRPELEIPQDRPIPDGVMNDRGYVDSSLIHVQVGWATEHPRARWEPSREGFTTAIDGGHYTEFAAQVLGDSGPSLREQMIADFNLSGIALFPFTPVLDGTGNIRVEQMGRENRTVWKDQNGQEFSMGLGELVSHLAGFIDTRHGFQACQDSLAQNPDVESVLNVLSIAIDRIDSLKTGQQPVIELQRQDPPVMPTNSP